MDNNIYSCSINFLIAIGRKTTKKYNIIGKEEENEPAVYVVHHQNLLGPITAILWLCKPKHLWVLSNFCSQRTCFKQYTDYTFTKRYRIPKLLACILAFPTSFIVSKLMKSIKAIPVYRGSRNIIRTINKSVDILKNGNSILISPDINYKDKGREMGPMYEGFLSIDRYYYKSTGGHVPFIPIHINNVKHNIYIGNKIYFTDFSNYKTEKGKVYEQLKTEFLTLQNLSENEILTSFY